MAVDVLTLLPSRPPVAALGMANRIMLWSMREWLRAAIAGEAVTPAIRRGLESFGMPDLAAPMAQFMEEASAAWPERLRLHPTGCGCPVSYDEWLLLRCLTDAGRNERETFDTRLREMINLPTRNKLWRLAVQLAVAAGRPSLK